jgi:uncharacterized protein (TIGR02145 family)
MRKALTTGILFIQFLGMAQTIQNVNKTNGNISSSDIVNVDSIVFTGNGSQMQIILNNAPAQTHLIQDISFVNFGNSTTTCGVPNVHNSNLTYGSITDQDGKTYKTIVIGSQEWMAENLNVAHYRNGDLIPVLTNDTMWIYQTDGACAWYNYDSAAYDCPHGRVYNWYAVSDPRGLCPSGWHVPSDAEWNILIGGLDSAYNPTGNGGQSFIVGDLLKSSSTVFWQHPNHNGSNGSGFSALGSGCVADAGFYSINTGGYYWTSTEAYNFFAWYRSLSDLSSIIQRGYRDKEHGNPVRCVRD